MPTSPSREPLLTAADTWPGTHITAVGAEAEGKQQLDPAIFSKADIVAADRSQCTDHGDISHAAKSGAIHPMSIVELGQVIKKPKLARTSDDQIPSPISPASPFKISRSLRPSTNV